MWQLQQARVGRSRGRKQAGGRAGFAVCFPYQSSRAGQAGRPAKAAPPADLEGLAGKGFRLPSQRQGCLRAEGIFVSDRGRGGSSVRTPRRDHFDPVGERADCNTGGGRGRRTRRTAAACRAQLPSEGGCLRVSDSPGGGGGWKCLACPNPSSPTREVARPPRCRPEAALNKVQPALAHRWDPVDPAGSTFRGANQSFRGVMNQI